MRSLATLVALLSPLALAAGCGTDPSSTDGGTCTGAKCDDLDLPDSEVPASACDGLMVDASGRGNDRVAGRLHDPLAEMLWHGESCPVTFGDIMAKLREVDKEGCAGERDGISTRAVSETAQITGSPTSYRLVTTRRCNGREEHEILFSLFGIRAGATTLPGNVEIIAFDKTAGVFNFYETTNGEINFFGNSKDMFKGPQGNTRRCANCHTGGGLIMKELDTPWMHWEGHSDTPGAADLVSGIADLGTKSSGANMESLVKAGNRAWNESRVTFMQEQGNLHELLRPLFCTVEVNVDNGSDFPTSPMSRIPSDSLLDPHLKGFGSINIDNADYLAQIATNGQNVSGTEKADTFFPDPFIERSNADNGYVDALISRGIITDEFAKDVLLVDFTRPIFSADRCGLLDQMPQGLPQGFTADDLKAATIEAFKTANPGTPEGDLLANLEAEGGHQAVVDTFFNACSGLTSKQITERAMRIQSLNRKQATELPVFEFAETLPSDNLRVDADSRLDPVSCDLATEFVSANTGAATP